MKTRFFIALAALLPMIPLLSARDSEIWVTANFKEGKWGEFSTTTHTHFRFPEDGYLRYYRVSQKLFY
jgi:hypothetical protein